MQDISYFISDLNSRVRTLENRYELLSERLLIVNQNMIESYKKLSTELNKITQELKTIKTSLTTLKETIKNLIKEMPEFATKQELKILEKYINFWNPLNFVTQKDIDNIINEKLKALKQKKGDKIARSRKKTK